LPPRSEAASHCIDGCDRGDGVFRREAHAQPVGLAPRQAGPRARCHALLATRTIMMTQRRHPCNGEAPRRLLIERRREHPPRACWILVVPAVMRSPPVTRVIRMPMRRLQLSRHGPTRPAGGTEFGLRRHGSRRYARHDDIACRFERQMAGGFVFLGDRLRSMVYKSSDALA
jgi:hypothetical protein